MLIELARSIGLQPKRTSSIQKGEYHSPCPSCGGADRFMIWPELGRYWCRQCKKSGDTIQFCRDFLGMSFSEACLNVGKNRLCVSQQPTKPSFPSRSWSEKAKSFVEGCHQRLLLDITAIEQIKTRGLSLDTIERYQIGWNPLTLFLSREEWGLEKRIENNKEKKLWLPSGVIIPSFHKETVCKIKIRRHDWHEEDRFGKYYILPGSIDCIPIFGNVNRDIAVIVEAEFDAMLVAQEAGDSCCCIALGGAQKKPDTILQSWLSEKSILIFALDFDEAGKREYAYWRSTYSNLYPWPVPVGKSPAEAWQKGVDLNEWVLTGIRRISADCHHSL